MTADTLTVPLATDLIGHLEKRLAKELAAQVEEWSECATALTRWEDEHLLENPEAELLQRHKTTIERLLHFGQLLSLLVEHPDFSDEKLADMVSATKAMLQDKLTMWHGDMAAAQREEILRVAFNES